MGIYKKKGRLISILIDKVGVKMVRLSGGGFYVGSMAKPVDKRRRARI